MKEKETPLSLVRYWSKAVPGCYNVLDDLRLMKDDGEMTWPDYCILPISAAYTYLVETYHDEQLAGRTAAELTACWTWRRNKVIYVFDKELAEALAGQAEDFPESEKLPIDIFLHLPYPCLYVKAPDVLEAADGFWAWLEYDMNFDRAELRAQFVAKDYSSSVPMMLHLLPGKTVAECFADTLKTTKDNYGDFGERISSEVNFAEYRPFAIALQLLLYLCSKNADIEDEPANVHMAKDETGRPAIIRDKASEVTGKFVGVRIGKALRSSKAMEKSGKPSGSSGGTVRPHPRRGHWHHFWTGPRTGERKLVLRWVAPTFIHPELGTGEVVAFPVKKKK